MSTMVTKDQDISQIPNGEFIFCKELKKGLIKRDFSDLSASTFAGVVQAIEGLSLKQLDLLGFNTTLFAGNYDENKGEIILSTKRDKIMYTKIESIRTMYPTENDISQFFGKELNVNRYFNLEKMNDIKVDIQEMDNMRKNSKCVNVKGEALAGFIITITGPGVNIKDTIGEDGTYDIPVCGLFMGVWQLQIKIYQNEEAVKNDTPLIVKDIDVLVPNKDLPVPEEDAENAIEYVSEPIELTVQPYERVEIKDENGVVIGQGVADKNGHVSIKTITYSEPSSYSVVVNGRPYTPSETISPIVKPNILPTNRSISYKSYPMETTIAELPVEEAPDGEIKPYIAGVNTPCSSIEFKIENGKSIGSSVTDENGNFKVYLDMTVFDLDYSGELFILVSPLNIDCQSALSELDPAVKASDLGVSDDIVEGFFEDKFCHKHVGSYGKGWEVRDAGQVIDDGYSDTANRLYGSNYILLYAPKSNMIVEFTGLGCNHCTFNPNITYLNGVSFTDLQIEKGTQIVLSKGFNKIYASNNAVIYLKRVA